MFFNSLVTKMKQSLNPGPRTPTKGTATAQPVSCMQDRTGAWICTLDNRQRLTVSGDSLVRKLRSSTSSNRATGIRRAMLRYPSSGLGQCMLHLTFQDGRTEVIRGRCGQARGANPIAAMALDVRAPRLPGTIPASPSTPPSNTGRFADLGPRCCFDPELMLIVCLDPTNPYNGREVAEIKSMDEATGLVMLRLTSPTGAPEYVRAPLCPDDDDQPAQPPNNQPIPDLGDCCYNVTNSTIVCPGTPGHPLNGMPVELVSVDENSGIVLVNIRDATGRITNRLQLPVCMDDDTPSIPSRPSLPPAPTIPPSIVDEQCCYNATFNKLVCKDPNSPLNGVDVILEAITTGPNGQELATVYIHGDPSNGLRVPVCSMPPCCLDIATATLICDSDPSSPFNGLKVSIEEVGQQNARVAHPDLGPYGFAYVPLCATPPAQLGGNCCFNQDTMTIECSDPSNPLHGQTAGLVTEFQYPNGMPGASISWPGGATRMPLCGRTPPAECPPSYCCVNLDTMTFVCPGTPELNGQPADVVDVKTNNGYTFAVLSDNTSVPVCGSACPPPELCPDGMWRTPAGDCAMPPECPTPTVPGGCPTCPPGMLLDTSTGQCVTPQCPPCPPNGQPPSHEDPPWWKEAGHCCESCAFGEECSGTDCGCDGGHDHDHDHGHTHSPKVKAIGPATWMIAQS